MSSLSAASRPTRRDVLRHPWRILAAVVLITIPVWFLTAMQVSFSSSGVADREFQFPEQVVWEGEGAPPPVEDYLPEGYSVTAHVEGSLQVNGYTIYAAESARLSGDELMLPSGDRERLNLQPGADVHSSSADFTFIGETPGYRALVAPHALDTAPTRWVQWEISGPEILTREQIDHLDDAGFAYSGRGLFVSDDWSSPGYGSLILGSVATALSALTAAVILLTLLSPAFTTAVSRQTRTFALMASQGASPRQLLVSVLTYGFAAGLVGSTAGVAGGAVTIWGYWRIHYPGWPVEAQWWTLALVWVGGVGAATLAALLPAWIVSRTSILQGLGGATNDRMMSWRRWMAIGPALLALSALTCITAILTPGERWTALYLLESLAALAGFSGLALSAPAVVLGLSRITGSLSVTLAHRDLRRQSLRSIPAVAAVALIAAGMSYIGSQEESSAERDREVFAQSYANNAVVVNLSATQFAEALDPQQAVTAIEDILGPVSWSLIETVAQPEVGFTELGFTESSEPEGCYFSYCSTSESNPTSFPSFIGITNVVATPDVLRAMNTDPALADGSRVLVSSAVESERGEFHAVNYDVPGARQQQSDATVLAVAPVLPRAQEAIFPTASAVAELGLDTSTAGLVAFASQPITREQAGRLGAVPKPGTVSALTGPDTRVNRYLQAGGTAAAIVLLVTLVLMLSREAARRQKILLDAVGAPPRLATTAFVYFGVAITLAGSLMGLVAGHVASALSLGPLPVSSFSADWRMALGLLIVAPLGVAATGWLLAPRSTDDTSTILNL